MLVNLGIRIKVFLGLFFCLLTHGTAFSQSSGSPGNKRTVTTTYNLGFIDIKDVDSVLLKTSPSKIEIDSIVDGKKVTSRVFEIERASLILSFEYGSNDKIERIITKDTLGNVLSSVSHEYYPGGKLKAKIDTDYIEQMSYSVAYTYDQNKTYLSEFIDGKKMITNVIWEDKNKRYHKVLNSGDQKGVNVIVFDKYMNPIREERIVNNKNELQISYLNSYNSLGILIRKLTLIAGKVFQMTIYN